MARFGSSPGLNVDVPSKLKDHKLIPDRVICAACPGRTWPALLVTSTRARVQNRHSGEYFRLPRQQACTTTVNPSDYTAVIDNGRQVQFSNRNFQEEALQHTSLLDSLPKARMLLVHRSGHRRLQVSVLAEQTGRVLTVTLSTTWLLG